MGKQRESETSQHPPTLLPPPPLLPKQTKVNKSILAKMRELEASGATTNVLYATQSASMRGTQ